MVEVLTFVIFIKNYFNMAEKETKSKSSSYDIGLGKLLIIFIISIFIIWVLTGGPNKKETNSNIILNKDSYPSAKKVPSYTRTVGKTTGEYNSWGIVNDN